MPDPSRIQFHFAVLTISMQASDKAIRFRVISTTLGSTLSQALKRVVSSDVQAEAHCPYCCASYCQTCPDWHLLAVYKLGALHSCNDVEHVLGPHCSIQGSSV